MDMFTDSDSESFTESTDTDDHDGIGSAYSGHAQSIFSCLDESLEKIDDFLAFQRGFLHGDIVSSISDPSKQLGRVVDVDMSVDLETNLGQLIKGVNSRKLARIRSFSSGDYVIHGHWLGIVRRIVERVTVLLNNGSKCEILAEDSNDLIPMSPSLFEDGSHPLYYPGQNVSVKHHSSSENAKWLRGSWKGGRTEGTICHIEVGLIHVKWITSFMCLGSIQSPPDHVLDPKMLTLLSCFSYTNWQIGDCCTLPNDYQHFSKLADKEHQSGARDQLYNEIYSIGKIRIKVDVLWQNGQVSVGVEPETLLPVSNIGDHDFWPGQFVMEKVACGDAHQSNARILGVVKSVESLEQIVTVKWIASELGQTDNFTGDMEEIVSAYELVEHPDASFSVGDIVTRFQNCGNFEENISNIIVKNEQIWEQKCVPGGTATSLLQVNGCKKNVDSSDHDDCATSYASHIGIVTGFKGESIEVRWASGVISKAHPYEVFCLDRLDELESSSMVHQVVEYVQKEMNNGGSNRALWDADVLLFPITAFRFLKNVAERIFSISYSSSPTCQNSSDFTHLDKIGECSLSPGSSLTRDNLQLVDGSRFKQFDCVIDYFDHHFTNIISKDVRSTWLKRVQREWSILREDLPESICVRVYEERVDLLRASIAGQSGTPYYHGLFFFDIHLPENYPQEPPHFEALVEEHFSERAHDILRACKAYMDGARVGSYGSDARSTNGGGNNSAGFRIMLAKIFPAIISSFTEKGIDCSQFADQPN
ncbi:putative ubiquitin-conjugating enzyme E2 24 [Platanthera zijinensis]|uniref:Ubiquitin-conjugating enzyme E2 24 n=1 Tax=Platanthera zijinensis TaxID=2320716 RepID=A0AAP0GGE1_9ASPA